MSKTKQKDWQAVAEKSKAEEIAKEMLQESAEAEVEITKAAEMAAAKAEQLKKEQAKTASAPESSEISASLADLENRLAKAESEREEYLKKYLRLLADLENVRKRAELDIAGAHKYGIEKFATEMLAIVDSLEKALETEVADDNQFKAVYTGVELTYKMFIEALQKFGITQINPKGQPFNPEQHSAMATREDPSMKPNTVLQVLQKGYLLKDRLLRPALVIVVK